MTHILTGLEAEVFEAVVSLICLLTPLSLSCRLSLASIAVDFTTGLLNLGSCRDPGLTALDPLERE